MAIGSGIQIPESPTQRDRVVLLFEQLAAWEYTPEVLRLFRRYHLKPIAFSRSELQEQIYQSLCHSLLEWTGTPDFPGSKYREWAELFRLHSVADPLYIMPEQIENTLECMEKHWHHKVVRTISDIMVLNSQGFPSSFPSPLISLLDTHRWLGCFPSEWKLPSLTILQSAGLLPSASLSTCRLLWRYLSGKLNHPVWHSLFDENILSVAQKILLKSPTLKLGADSQQMLQDPQYGPAAVHFLLANFGDGFGSLNAQGPCQEKPHCYKCCLRQSCSWYLKIPAQSHYSPGALFSSAQEQHLLLPQLMETIFSLDKSQTQTLTDILPKHGLKSLVELPPQELQQWCRTLSIPTDNLRALLEICRRFEIELIPTHAPVKTAWEIFKHFQARFRTLKQEQFFIIMLDKKRRFIGECLITQGTLDASPIHPREVFNPAIKYNAHSIIVVHNHPSGDPQPSKADIAVTKGLIQSGNTLGIPLQDHIIIGQEHYTSLQEMGLFK